MTQPSSPAATTDHGTVDRIAHLSDLHFGTEWPELPDLLLQDLEQQKPDIIAISGDLTQRAREREFRAARAFLDRLTVPWILVPGNHDLAPLFRPFERLFRPLEAFRRWIPENRFSIAGDHALIMPLNSARRLRIAGGRPRRRRIDQAFEKAGSHPVPVFLLHHPPGAWRRFQKHLSPRLLNHLPPYEEGACPPVLLCGHHHVPEIGLAEQGRFFRPGQTTLQYGRALFVTAGTALSSRLRGHPNSYNLIDIGIDTIRISVRSRTGNLPLQPETAGKKCPASEEFAETDCHSFLHENGLWVMLPNSAEDSYSSLA